MKYTGESKPAISETWEITELKATIAAMQEFKVRCGELLQLIDGNICRKEFAEIKRLYAELKADLKSASRYGTLSGRRQTQTPIESAFYDPAVRKALIAFRPATNSNPWNSGWFAAVYEAELEFSYFLCQLEELLEKDAIRP